VVVVFLQNRERAGLIKKAHADG